MERLEFYDSRNPPKGKRSSLLSFSRKFYYLSALFLCSLVTVCSYCFAFLSANDRNVFCGWKGIAFIVFFQICFLKSPLTALIVTGFCCFSSETRLYKKHTETGKNKLCECSMDGCVLNLYSHCKIKTACLDQCYVNVSCYSWALRRTREDLTSFFKDDHKRHKLLKCLLRVILRIHTVPPKGRCRKDISCTTNSLPAAVRWALKFKLTLSSRAGEVVQCLSLKGTLTGLVAAAGIKPVIWKLQDSFVNFCPKDFICLSQFNCEASTQKVLRISLNTARWRPSKRHLPMKTMWYSRKFTSGNCCFQGEKWTAKASVQWCNDI